MRKLFFILAFLFMCVTTHAQAIEIQPIQRGTLAQRATLTPYAGRLFWVTDSGVERPTYYNGTMWVDLLTSGGFCVGCPASSTITLNAGSGTGYTTPGVMTLGGTYTFGATTDVLQIAREGFGIAADSAALAKFATSNTYPALRFTGNGSTTDDIARYDNLESGKGDFTSSLAHMPGNNGEPRRDNVFQYGFNCQNSSAYVNTDQTFCWTLENDFKTNTGIRQMEFYYAFNDPNNSYSSRPFTITPNLQGAGVISRFNSEQLIIGSFDDSFEWLSFNSTTTSGDIVFSGNSQINYDGTVADFIIAHGHELLGYDSTNHNTRLGGSDPLINLFPGNSTGNTLMVTWGDLAGNNRTMRWNASTQQWEAQLNAGGVYAPITNLNYFSCNETTEYSASISDVLGGCGSGPEQSTLTINVSTTATFHDSSRLTIKGSNASWQGNYIDIVNSSNTFLAKMDSSGHWIADEFRLLNSKAALEHSQLGGVAMTSDYFVGWSSSSSSYNSIDVAIGRNTVGVAEVDNGNTGTFRDLATRNHLFKGTTSGTITMAPGATPTSYTFTLPQNAGTANYALITDGSGTTSWASGQSLAGLTTSSNVQFNSLGVGTAASGTAGRVDINGRLFVPNATAASAATSADACFSSGEIVNDTALCIISARRFKNTIEDSAIGLDMIKQLHPVSYYLNDSPERGQQFGFVAEEVEAIDNRFVTYQKDGQIRSVLYIELIPVLTRAIQQLEKRVAELEAK